MSESSWPKGVACPQCGADARDCVELVREPCWLSAWRAMFPPVPTESRFPPTPPRPMLPQRPPRAYLAERLVPTSFPCCDKRDATCTWTDEGMLLNPEAHRDGPVFGEALVEEGILRGLPETEDLLWDGMIPDRDRQAVHRKKRAA